MDYDSLFQVDLERKEVMKDINWICEVNRPTSPLHPRKSTPSVVDQQNVTCIKDRSTLENTSHGDR